MSPRTRPRSAVCLGAVLLALVVLPLAGQSNPTYPRLSDNRLQIALYAENPDIVTPIGAAVDARGRLFVVESHTHNPPPDYDGPKGDLIKVFEGQRPDGRAQRVSVFADDLFQAQSIAFDPKGTLYVVCTRGLYVLHDRDGDGRSEARTRILTIAPYEKRANPHGQMQGITFSPDGWVYVGRGAHVGGEYAWVGADGRELARPVRWRRHRSHPPRRQRAGAGRHRLLESVRPHGRPSGSRHRRRQRSRRARSESPASHRERWRLRLQDAVRPVRPASLSRLGRRCSGNAADDLRRWRSADCGHRREHGAAARRIQGFAPRCRLG